MGRGFNHWNWNLDNPWGMARKRKQKYRGSSEDFSGTAPVNLQSGSANVMPFHGGQIIQAPETYGNVIPITGGQRRVLGSYIWMSISTAGIMDCAVAFGAPADETAASSVTKIWADGGVLYEASTGTILSGMSAPVWYDGGEDQVVDSDIAADYGTERTPAYRGIMYVKLQGIDIVKYFNGRPPSIEAFISDSGGITWTLEEIIKTTGKLGGFTDAQMDVAANIDDPVVGPYIIDPTTARDVWLAMGRAWGINVVDGGPAIKFTRSIKDDTYTVAKTIPEADLILPTNASALKLTRRDQQDVPGRIEVNYVDEAQPWRFSTRPARRVLQPFQATLANQAQAIKLQIIMSAIAAQTIASKALYRESEGRVVLRFALPWLHIALEPGDVIEAPFGDQTETLRIIRADIAPDMTMDVTAIRLNVAENYTRNAEIGLIGEPVYTPPAALEPTILLDFVNGEYTYNGATVAIGDVLMDPPTGMDWAGTFEPGTHIIANRGYGYFYDNLAGAEATGDLLALFQEAYTVVIEWEDLEYHFSTGGLISLSSGGSGNFTQFFSTFINLYMLDIVTGGGTNEWDLGAAATEVVRPYQTYGVNRVAITVGGALSNISMNGSELVSGSSIDTTSLFTDFPISQVFPFGVDGAIGDPINAWVRRLEVYPVLADPEDLVTLSTIATPDRVTDLAVAASGTTTITLSFSAVSGATSYEYWISDSGHDWYPTPWDDDTFTALPGDKIITGLTTATDYSIMVRAVNASGPGPMSTDGSTYTHVNATTT